MLPNARNVCLPDSRYSFEWGAHRRLRAFASAAAFGEAVFFAALAPLLPTIASDLSLSRVGVGILVAAYPIGVCAGALPAAALAVRWGPRNTARAGVATLALSSLGFAVAASEPTLVLARLVQGVGAAGAWGGALAWTTLRTAPDRRGAVVGAVLGAGFAGTIAAPVLALGAERAGYTAVFIPIALALGAVAVWGGPREDEPARSEPGLTRSVRMLREPPVVTALGLMGVVGALMALVQSLGPLHLSDHGISNTTIALIFLAGYAPQVVIAPTLGHLADRFGPLSVLATTFGLAGLLLALLASISDPAAVCVLFTLVIVVTLSAWSPATLLVSQFTDARGGPQESVGALTNGAWAGGAALGAITLSKTAAALGATAAFAVASSVALAVALACSLGAIRAVSPAREALARVGSRGSQDQRSEC